MSDPTPEPSGVRARKRMHLSLEKKVEVIKRVDSGERKTYIARSLGLNESTIRTIYANKKDILACVKTFGGTSFAARSKVACRALIMTERYLEEFICRQHCNNLPVNSTAIKQHALAFYKVAAMKIGVPPDKFRASTGWLSSFLMKRKIKNVKLIGERAKADEVEADKFPDLLAEYKRRADHEGHSQYTSQPSEAFDVTSGCHDDDSQDKNSTFNPAEVPDTYKEVIHSDGENDFLAIHQPTQDITVTTGNHHASEEIRNNSESNEGGDAAITVDVIDVEWVKEELEGEEIIDEDMMEYLQETDTNWTTFKPVTGSQMIEKEHNSHHCPTLSAPCDSNSNHHPVEWDSKKRKSRGESETEEEGQKDPEEVFAEYMKVSLKGLSSKQRRIAKVRMLQVLMECEEADD